MKYQTMKKIGASVLVAALADVACGTEDARIQALEKQMEATQAEIATLKGERQDLSFLEKEESKLTLGGYGEIHANFEVGGKDYIDIHRLVMYVGYEFADWIHLSSEVELEHAYISSDSGGELSIEQLYVDFLLADAASIRAGRILAPMGIINQKHEPTLFFGVERPMVDKVIIPTTWSLDGAGVFGSPLSWLSYEAYAVAGLQGSGFDGSDGIRGGRNKERQGLNDPAITGRIDFFPFVDAGLPANQDLRFGISGYYGGTENSNKGGAPTNSVANTFTMVSADVEYSVSRLIFRGVVAHGKNSDAAALNTAYGNDAGEEIFGWYLEGGMSVMPESWKKEKMKEADLIPFIRYEQYDTQHKVPTGTPRDEANNRTETTIGVNLLLTQNLVVKADCQFRANGVSGSDLNNKYNLGIGWVFK
jgi:hypothetical protein